MKKLACLIMSVLIVMSLYVSCYAGHHDADDRAERLFGTREHLKYTLYIGLNASDTGKQVYPTDEAKQRFNQIANEFVSGYTLYDADGFWKEDGKTYTEHTLVCVIVDTEPETVKNLMNAVLKDFRQSSILIEVDEVESAFYSGK